MSTNLKALIGKLNDTARRVFEAAAGLCVARTHYDIEIEHYLLKALDGSDNDVAAILKHFGVDRSRLTSELERSLDNLKSGNARSPAFSPTVVKMVVEAWTVASIDFDAGSVRTGFTLLALLGNEDLARLTREISKELQRIPPEGLRASFYDIVGSSKESEIPLGGDGASEKTGSTAGGDGVPVAGRGKTPHLDQYTVNLTANAKAGKIDPVLGRDQEVRQMIDILMRRRQNNPILTGEAGVGKTAVVEGFANRVVSGDVPPALQSVHLHSLDLALLQAGAGVKGEFENRLKGLINEIKSSTEKIILFIDEAHTMIGAGGVAGQNDAANLLKPALARGELRTIAATTWSEYKKYFEKDPALARRFQVVKVEEPSEDVACTMLRGIVGPLEKHHGLRILDEAVTATVRLSHRYIAGRQLPDKAVSVLDTACARLSLGQNSTPPRIEDILRRVDDLEVQKRVLERETNIGADHAERLLEIDTQVGTARQELGSLQTQFEKEKALVGRIRELQAGLESKGEPHATAAGSPGESRKELARLEAQLDALQGERGMIRVSVDAQIVGEVISAWTGIPLGKMVKDEIATVLTLDDHLKKRVIGQDHALSTIAQRIITSRANLDDPVKPVGVFLLVGPSGVGKTETAIALADILYGGERNMITINMSEFQEAHTVSTLKGSPPGYVGYGEGGVLTEAVRRRPYSVVLLDEVEKAHPDVLELFFQVFDKGRMEDGEGREIDFRNTIILLTSNAATDTLMKLCADPETMPNGDGLLLAMKPELNKVFKPAFLGRMLIVPYFPVRDEAFKQIIRLKLDKIRRRLLETHKITLNYDEVLLNEVAARCTEVESGARNVDNILSNTMLPDISRQILGRLAGGELSEHVAVSVDGGALTYDWGGRHEGLGTALSLMIEPSRSTWKPAGENVGNLKQSGRLMRFSSPLGRDVLLIERLDGAEGISRLFEFHAQLLAAFDTTVDPKTLVGSKVSIAIALNDAPGSRWVNGIVASFEQSSGDVEFYQARIVPSLWQLTLSSNCRVFQNLTVMDIVKKVIGDYGLSLSDQTNTVYKTLDYCTQYDESDFHFVSRILEQSGIFYWFEHTEHDNKIVFGDGRTAYADCPLSSSVLYEPDGSGREGAYGSGVSEFSATAAMVSGKHSTRDYDFRTYAPHDVPAKASSSLYGKNGYEDFRYPAGEEGYVKETDKELSTPDFATVFLDSEAVASDAVSEVFHGTSNARSFCCGCTFTMGKHPRSAWNRKYLLTEVVHQVSQVPSYKANGMAGGSGYGNRFSAVSSDLVFKPPLTARRPRIYGPQTAMVVAPSGEEMFIDKLGRVCVQFFWDRLRQPNTIDNTWVRVAQSWAGSGWGTFFWPRLNDEVVVQFLNGDPDNPVVTGSVYNGVNVPKYKLPDMSTRSGLVTRSSKGGSAQNANELRFEDKSGSEQIFLNAERDMDHRTENDNRRFVGGKDSLIVKGAQYKEVDTDRHANIKGNAVDKVGGNSDINITSNLNEKVGSNYSLQVGQNHGEKVGQNYALDAGLEVYIKAGMTLVIESGMELCLKGAGGFITIGPAGIAISGTMVLINSGGAAVSGSPPSLQSPGDPTAPDEADDGSKGGKSN